MIDTSRFKMTWSRSAVKWIALEDRKTGLRTIGRDNDSWDVAMYRAIDQMRHLI